MTQFDAAISDASHAIRINPDHYRAHVYRGLADNDNRQYDAAMAGYSKAIEIDPEEADAYCFQGLTFQNVGRLDLAIAHYGKALSLNPMHRASRQYMAAQLRPKKGWLW